jgi:ribosomal protein L37AE/L43A
MKSYCDNKVMKRPTFGIAKYGSEKLLPCLAQIVKKHGTHVCPSCGKEYPNFKE